MAQCNSTDPIWRNRCAYAEGHSGSHEAFCECTWFDGADSKKHLASECALHENIRHHRKEVSITVEELTSPCGCVNVSVNGVVGLAPCFQHPITDRVGVTLLERRYCGCRETLDQEGRKQVLFCDVHRTPSPKVLPVEELQPTGRKDDDGKMSWELLFDCAAALDEVAWVLLHGRKKYGPRNWRLVSDHRDRYLGALLRHVSAYAQGQTHDPESGRHHLGHVLCCALFLLTKELEEKAKVET